MKALCTVILAYGEHALGMRDVRVYACHRARWREGCLGAGVGHGINPIPKSACVWKGLRAK